MPSACFALLTSLYHMVDEIMWPLKLDKLLVQWAMFVIAFLTSNHANKIFAKMFPDSATPCSRHIKTTAIIKEALAPG